MEQARHVLHVAPAAFSLSLHLGNLPLGTVARGRSTRHAQLSLGWPTRSPSSTPSLRGLFTWVEEWGSRPQSLHIHNGIEDKQDEEGKGAQCGDIRNGPTRQMRCFRAPEEHIQRQEDQPNIKMTLFSIPTTDFCLLE